MKYGTKQFSNAMETIRQYANIDDGEFFAQFRPEPESEKDWEKEVGDKSLREVLGEFDTKDKCIRTLKSSNIYSKFKGKGTFYIRQVGVHGPVDFVN